MPCFKSGDHVVVQCIGSDVGLLRMLLLPGSTRGVVDSYLKYPVGTNRETVIYRVWIISRPGICWLCSEDRLTATLTQELVNWVKGEGNGAV